MQNITKRSGRWAARWRGLRLALVACAVVVPTFAQGLGQILPGSGNANSTLPGGFYLYSVSAFSQYSTQALPFGGTMPTNGADLGPATTVGGGASMGWIRRGSRSDISVTYSLLYDANLRYSQWNSLAQSMSIAAHRKLGPRWNFSFSANGATSTWDQYLFAPGIFSWVSDVPPTFDQLMAGVLAGKYTNDQLASILTGAPILESPARTLLFGTRVLMSNLQTSVTYQQSARLSVSFNVGATRFQNLYDQSQKDLAGSRYLLPHATAGTVTAGLSYSLTPRTQLSVDVGSGRTFSSFEDAYITTANFTVGRSMGQHWFADARGGAGVITPVRATYKIPSGPRYSVGGLVGYKAHAQSFTLACDRSITDTFGLGAQYTLATTGSWAWQRPGRSWALFAAASDQRFDAPGLQQFSGWVVSAGLSRRLSRQTTMELAYAHANNSAGPYLQNATFSADSGRLILSWSPQPRR